MDQQRMVAVRHWMQCLVKLASVLVVTLNMVGKHLASDAEYKKKLKENILLLLKGTQERYRNFQKPEYNIKSCSPSGKSKDFSPSFTSLLMYSLLF